MTTKGSIRLLSYAAFALVLAVSAGCESSDPTAATDWTILVRANPGTVNIDPNLGQSEGRTEIQASLFDAEGVPQSDIAVAFTTSDGVLASGGIAQKTDAYGVARDTLTLIASSAETVEVTASSSSIAERVQVKKTLGKLNQEPLAAVIAIPKFDAQTADARPDFPVTFDGSLSTDPDKDPITMYRWEITSTNPDDPTKNPIVIEDPAFSSIQFPSQNYPVFHNEQDLTVVLRVSDQPVVPNEPVVFSPKIFTDQYQIRDCAGVVNQAPTAVIANADPVIVTGAPGQNVSARMDGTPSRDPEGFDLDYTWSCGNGSLPIPEDELKRVVVNCSYKVQSVVVEYVVTLSVADHGDGTQSGDGNWCGQKFAGPVSVKVRVGPLQ